MKSISFFFALTILFSKSFSQTNNTAVTDWCNHPPREAFSKLKEIKGISHWFKVYSVGENLIAITEPYNFEEVISYLIIGKDKALLFDTGMGLDSISSVIKQLTQLPVTVLNSHTHPDHIGGNYEFRNILAMKTNFTLLHAKEGWSHDAIKWEVTKDAFCMQKLPGMDTARYAIKPFHISRFVKDGDEIDLGGRKLQIISVPGHTPDAIALLDKTNGYLFTGDTFYEGPIYLFAEETDIVAYEKSITKLAALVPQVKTVFPAHNNPVCEPARLTELKSNFDKLKQGSVKGEDKGQNTFLFKFQYFDYLIQKDQLEKLQKKGIAN